VAGDVEDPPVVRKKSTQPGCGPQKFRPNDKAVAQVLVEYGVADVHPVVLFLSCRSGCPPQKVRPRWFDTVLARNENASRLLNLEEASSYKSRYIGSLAM
jgi:hypothetical protein